MNEHFTQSDSRPTCGARQYIFPLRFYKHISDVEDSEYAQALPETGREGQRVQDD